MPPKTEKGKDQGHTKRLILPPFRGAAKWEAGRKRVHVHPSGTEFRLYGGKNLKVRVEVEG